LRDVTSEREDPPDSRVGGGANHSLLIIRRHS
jgi:hypothetical protein